MGRCSHNAIGKLNELFFSVRQCTTVGSMKNSLSLLLSISFLSLVSLLLLFKSRPASLHTPLLQNSAFRSQTRLKVHVADLPRTLNYGLLDHYWSLSGPDSRIGTDPDGDLRAFLSSAPRRSNPPPYPENPLIKQYSAEYWLLRDLETPEESSVAERVYDWRNADVVFVPFFATLSAEMELGWGKKGRFIKKDGNGDYLRQRGCRSDQEI
ncbi:hypothetical protein HPP92_002010 [Vanilla planifolia]|uniref:Exostosin GT47 domain-containing protein n=1 Tax=Vanilla planifolia TaxID=51239 RepID=A0A835VM38_VANPL|nr:hypothetical protein HPP92_002010 [Vanilla planifolia]